MRVPVFLLGIGQFSVGCIADEVLDAKELGIRTGAVEEHALKHIVVTAAGMTSAVMLRNDLEFGVILGDVDAAEVEVRPGHGTAGFGVAVGGFTGHGHGSQCADCAKEFATIHRGLQERKSVDIIVWRDSTGTAFPAASHGKRSSRFFQNLLLAVASDSD
jgi:hypothetical protein